MDEVRYKYIQLRKKLERLIIRIDVLKQLLADLQSQPIKNQLDLFDELKM